MPHLLRQLVAAGALLLTVAREATSQSLPTDTMRLVREVVVASNDSQPGMAMTGITSIAVLRNGGIVTAHRSESLLRIFGEDGRLLRSIGGAGQGPAEFTRLASAGTIGDTIWAYDDRALRASLFRVDGSLIRTVPVPRSPYEGGVRTLAYLPGDRFLFERSYYPEGPAYPPRQRDSTLFQTIDSRGSRIGTFFQAPREPAGAIPLSAGRGQFIPQPLIPPFVTSASPDGRLFIAFEASSIGGDRNTLVLREVLSDGRTVETNLQLQARPLTAAHIARHTGQLGLPNTSPDVEASMRDVAAHLYKPAFAPLFREMHAGVAGVIWIREYNDPELWHIVEGSRVVKSVRVPVPLRVMAVSSDRVWTLRTDDDGLPVIERHVVRPR